MAAGSSAAAAVLALAATTTLLLAAPSALAQAPAPGPSPASSTSPCPAILDKIILAGGGLISPPEVTQIREALGSLGSLRGAQCVCDVVVRSFSIGHGIGGAIPGGGPPPVTGFVEVLLRTVGATAPAAGFTCNAAD